MKPHELPDAPGEEREGEMWTEPRPSKDTQPTKDASRSGESHTVTESWLLPAPERGLESGQSRSVAWRQLQDSQAGSKHVHCGN